MHYEKAFAEWWQVYPRRVGKKVAVACWKDAIHDISTEKGVMPSYAMRWLLERTTAYAASAKGLSGKFCPHPKTWLREGRYDDDPAEWQDQDSGSKAEQRTSSNLAVLEQVLQQEAKT